MSVTKDQQRQVSGPSGPVVDPASTTADVIIELTPPLGAVLRGRREQLAWTQARLAAESGVSRTMINEIEAGKRAPSLRTYKKLRAALGHPVSAAVALIPAAAPEAAGERFLATLAAALLSMRRPALADLAAALGVTVPAVRAGLTEPGRWPRWDGRRRRRGARRPNPAPLHPRRRRCNEQPC